MRTNFRYAAILVAAQLGLAAPFALADDETEADNNVMTSEIHFQFDSAELSASGRAQLDKAAGWIRDNRADLIVIAGYTDKVGSEPYNKALAERRAAAVEGYLL
ncbi:MAG TPA: OmpA family protein, partial [Kofleriaceae bacterium]|nr:OmpA family protein [Kofleriaceae bacterium]